MNHITKIKCYTIDCSYDWKSKQKKIINETKVCIDSCVNNTQYVYESNGRCYKNCLNGIARDNICKCELEQCLICSEVALKNGLCNECNKNYYPKENDLLNIGDYINCYKELEHEGYYLDNKDSIYRKCFNACDTCEVGGDYIIHNCTSCNYKYPYTIRINNYLNCYPNCTYYHYFDEEYNYHCTMNDSCPEGYSQFIPEKSECIKYSQIHMYIHIYTQIYLLKYYLKKKYAQNKSLSKKRKHKNVLKTVILLI